MEPVNTTTPEPGAVVPSADERIDAMASQIATAAAEARQAALTLKEAEARVILGHLELQANPERNRP